MSRHWASPRARTGGEGGCHRRRGAFPARRSGRVAKKALRVNLSDLAAKGASPVGYLLALSLPDWVGDEWLTRFAAGLAEDQLLYGVSLLGGDTTSTPGPLTLAVTALGSIETGRTIRRAGAKPGDAVFVSGSIGDAGAGLAVLSGGGANLGEADRASLVGRYRLPEPRLALGRRLIGLASAALDVSDGLIADLGHIAEVSRVRIVVHAPRIPLSSAYVALWGQDTGARLRAATAGDDYEIAFTAPEGARGHCEGRGRNRRRGARDWARRGGGGDRPFGCARPTGAGGPPGLHPFLNAGR